jgi:hypothetical protein
MVIIKNLKGHFFTIYIFFKLLKKKDNFIKIYLKQIFHKLFKFLRNYNLK